MILPPIPVNEQERLDELANYDILDTLPEQAYDDIVNIAAQICGTPIALITLVDKDRQWFKSKLGMAESGTPRDIAFCAHAINEPLELMEVENAQEDERFRGNPLTTGPNQIAFYAGAPLLTPNGNALGTICVIDNKANKLNASQRESLKALSRQVMALMELKVKNQQVIDAQVAIDEAKKKYTEKLDRYQQSLLSLNEISSNSSLDIDGQLDAALKIACDYFDLSLGMISHIDGEKYSVVHQYICDKGFDAKVSKEYHLSDTYCDLTYKSEDGNMAVHDMENSAYANHACYQNLKLGAYIGNCYYVRGQKRGTVCFSSLEKHEEFQSYEVKFMALVAQIVGYKIERMESDQLLIREKSILEAFIARAPRSIAMFDRDFNYMATSGRWKSESHLDGKNIEGLSHFALFPEDEAYWKDVFETTLGGIPLYRDEEEINPGKWIKWECRPWQNMSGEIDGIIVFVEDITDQKKQKDELRIAKLAAESASKAKETFLSNMSHEIRTPLNSIIGFTHLLLMDNPREDQQENLKMLKFSGENLMVIINDILDIGKIRSGKIQFEPHDFDLEELIKSVAHSLKFRYEEKNVSFEIHYAENLPKVFVGDAVRIAQVLTNLVSNALKFTESGSVEVFMTHGGQVENGTIIKVRVKDTGIGIHPDKIDAIFEEFVQESSVSTRKYEGTGLGLTITKSLLNLMGCKIKVKSKVGVGSEFMFEIVLPIGDPTQVKRSLNKTFNEQSKSSLEDIRILVAEDNLANQLVISKFLKKWGIAMDFASNGQEVIDAIHRTKYSLILMDLQMPVMDGYQAAKVLRKSSDPYHKNIPIVALTASAMVDVKMKVLKSGMNDHISKPFNPDELYNKILTYAHRIDQKLTKARKYRAILEELADGDKAFIKELCHLYIDNFVEFRDHAREAILTNNKESLEKYAHKAKTTFLTLAMAEEFEQLRILTENMPLKTIDDKDTAIQWIDEATKEIVADMHSAIEG